VSFANITFCVASQRVFILVSVYFVMTQSGNFWINPRRAGLAQSVWRLNGLDDRGSFPGRERNIYIYLRHRVQAGSGAHPASYPVDTGGTFSGVKRPGRESDHSLPFSAEVKNARSYTSSPHIRLHGMVFR